MEVLIRRIGRASILTEDDVGGVVSRIDIDLAHNPTRPQINLVDCHAGDVLPGGLEQTP